MYGRFINSILGRFGLDGDAFSPEDFNKIIVLGCKHFIMICVGVGYKEFLALYDHLGNAFVVDHGKEFRVTEFGFGQLLLIEKIVEHDHHQGDDKP